MTDPLISVIVPFCNEEKYISDAIDSLINQTYKNIEIVLVNDHSTDKSKEVCLGYNDSRVKYYEKFDIPMGRAWSRNFGIKKSLGDIITFLDADDVCSPERIELQLSKLIEIGINSTICGCWVEKKGIENVLMRMPIEHEAIIKGFARQYNRTTIVGATIMGHKDIFLKHVYRTKFKFYEDWDLLIRLGESKQIKFVNVGIPLYTYMIRSKGTKYQSDWLSYNIFLRNCQLRRREGKKEYDTPEQMFREVRRNEIGKYLFYKSFQKLIQFKRYLRI